MPSGAAPGLVGLASAYKAGTLIAPHAHSAHQIVHAISGTMRVSVQDRMWFLPPGRGLWVPARTRHAIRCVGPVDMRTAYLSEIYPVAHSGVALTAVSPLMRETLLRIAAGANPDLALLLAEVLLAEIRAGLLAPLSLPIPADPRIARLARHLQDHPSDQTGLTSWARHLGFSERNLIRHIRTGTGMTFRELRRLTRVMVALDKLATGQSVTTTAYDVGFETPSAFIHAFRTVHGQTPRQFLARP